MPRPRQVDKIETDRQKIDIRAFKSKIAEGKERKSKKFIQNQLPSFNSDNVAQSVELGIGATSLDLTNDSEIVSR